jgi:hypothetical protein
LISGRRSTALVSDERLKEFHWQVVKLGSSMAEAAGKYLKKSVLIRW